MQIISLYLLLGVYFVSLPKVTDYYDRLARPKLRKALESVRNLLLREKTTKVPQFSKDFGANWQWDSEWDLDEMMSGPIGRSASKPNINEEEDWNIAADDGWSAEMASPSSSVTTTTRGNLSLPIASRRASHDKMPPFKLAAGSNDSVGMVRLRQLRRRSNRRPTTLLQLNDGISPDASNAHLSVYTNGASGRIVRDRPASLVSERSGKLRPRTVRLSDRHLDGGTEDLPFISPRPISGMPIPYYDSSTLPPDAMEAFPRVVDDILVLEGIGKRTIIICYDVMCIVFFLLKTAFCIGLTYLVALTAQRYVIWLYAFIYQFIQGRLVPSQGSSKKEQETCVRMTYKSFFSPMSP
ncbi:unnamed protein product [Protopolystoma xenopodis]|uniref:Uncharacterized protein n=1 Tax=Protopolystoma xenopodis TaxID=117903 RepID=A0A3S5BV83_9PLAT|nr:unnamed protein product [Protopolystoma xenopodis]